MTKHEQWKEQYSWGDLGVIAVVQHYRALDWTAKYAPGRLQDDYKDLGYDCEVRPPGPRGVWTKVEVRHRKNKEGKRDHEWTSQHDFTERDIIFGTVENMERIKPENRPRVGIYVNHPMTHAAFFKIPPPGKEEIYGWYVEERRNPTVKSDDPVPQWKVPLGRVDFRRLRK